MSAKWGQRLGNFIAIITLVTAAGALYALALRGEPRERSAREADSLRGVTGK